MAVAAKRILRVRDNPQYRSRCQDKILWFAPTFVGFAQSIEQHRIGPQVAEGAVYPQLLRWMGLQLTLWCVRRGRLQEGK